MSADGRLEEKQGAIVVELAESKAAEPVIMQPEFNSVASARLPDQFVFGDGERGDLLTLIQQDVANGHAFLEDRAWERLVTILKNPLISPENLARLGEEFRHGLEESLHDPEVIPPWQSPNLMQAVQLYSTEKTQLLFILTAAYKSGQQKRNELGLPPSHIIRSGRALTAGMGAFHVILSQAIVAADVRLQQPFSLGSIRVLQLRDFFDKRIKAESSVQSYVNDHRKLPPLTMHRLRQVLQHCPIGTDDATAFKSLMAHAKEFSLEDCLSINYFIRAVMPAVATEDVNEEDEGMGSGPDPLAKDADSLKTFMLLLPAAVAEVKKFIEAAKDSEVGQRILDYKSSPTPEKLYEIVRGNEPLLAIMRRYIEQTAQSGFAASPVGDAAAEQLIETIDDPLAGNPGLLLYLVDSLPITQELLQAMDHPLKDERLPESIPERAKIIKAVCTALKQDAKLMQVLRSHIGFLEKFFLHLSRRYFHLPDPSADIWSDITLFFDVLPKDQSCRFEIQNQAGQLTLYRITAGIDGEVNKRIIEAYNIRAGMEKVYRGLLAHQKGELMAGLDDELVDKGDDRIDNGRGAKRTKGQLTVALKARFDNVKNHSRDFLATLFMVSPAGFGERALSYAQPDNYVTPYLQRTAADFKLFVAKVYVDKVIPAFLSQLAADDMLSISQIIQQAVYNCLQDFSYEDDSSSLDNVVEEIFERMATHLLKSVGVHYAKKTRDALGEAGSDLGAYAGVVHGENSIGDLQRYIQAMAAGTGDQKAMLSIQRNLHQSLVRDYSVSARSVLQKMISKIYLTEILAAQLHKMLETLYPSVDVSEEDFDYYQQFLEALSITESESATLIFIQLLASKVSDDEHEARKTTVRQMLVEKKLNTHASYDATRLLLDENSGKTSSIKNPAQEWEKALICIDYLANGDNRIQVAVTTLDMVLSRIDDFTGEAVEAKEFLDILAFRYSAKSEAPLHFLQSVTEEVVKAEISKLVANCIRMAFFTLKAAIPSRYTGRDAYTLLVSLHPLLLESGLLSAEQRALAKIVEDLDAIANIEFDYVNPLLLHHYLCAMSEVVNSAFQLIAKKGLLRVLPGLADAALQIPVFEKSSPAYFAQVAVLSANAPLAGEREAALPFSLKALLDEDLKVLHETPQYVFEALSQQLLESCSSESDDEGSDEVHRLLRTCCDELIATYDRSVEGQVRKLKDDLVFLSKELFNVMRNFLYQLTISHFVDDIISDLAHVAIFRFDSLNQYHLLKKWQEVFKWFYKVKLISNAMRSDDSRFERTASLTKLMLPLFCLDSAVLLRMPPAIRQYFPHEYSRMVAQLAGLPDQADLSAAAARDMAADGGASHTALRRPGAIPLVAGLLVEPVLLMCLFEQVLVLVGVFFGPLPYYSLRSILGHWATITASVLVTWLLHAVAEIDRIPQVQSKLTDQNTKGLAVLRGLLPTLSGVSGQMHFNFFLKSCLLAIGVDWLLGLEGMIVNEDRFICDNVNDGNISDTTTTQIITTTIPKMTTTTSSVNYVYSWPPIIWGYFILALLGIFSRIIDITFLCRFPDLSSNVGNKPENGETTRFELQVSLTPEERKQVHIHRMIEIHVFNFIMTAVSVDAFLSSMKVGCNDDTRSWWALAFGVLQIISNLLAFPCCKKEKDDEAIWCLTDASHNPWVQRIAVMYNLLPTLSALFYFVSLAVSSILIDNFAAVAADVSVESDSPYQATVISVLVVSMALLLFDRFAGLGASPFAGEQERADTAGQAAHSKWLAILSILNPDRRVMVRTTGETVDSEPTRRQSWV